MKVRPEVLEGKTIKVKTDCGSMYLILNYHKDSLYEVRMDLGKSGHCQKGLLHLLGILISEKIQTTENIKDLKKFLTRHLSKFSCGSPFIHKGENYKSCIDYAASKIIESIKEDEEKKVDENPK